MSGCELKKSGSWRECAANEWEYGGVNRSGWSGLEWMGVDGCR